MCWWYIAFYSTVNHKYAPCTGSAFELSVNGYVENELLSQMNKTLVK